MQHEAECESAPDGIPEPAQVPRRVRSRCGVGLDFNADYPAIAEFNEYVHFMPAVRVADVKQMGRKLAHRALGSQLRHDEAVEQQPSFSNSPREGISAIARGLTSAGMREMAHSCG